MTDVQQVGRTTGVGRIDVLQPQPHVVRHADAAHSGCVTGAEVAVNVVLLKPRIGERALSTLGMQLHDRFIGRFARGMLECSHDISLTFDAHMAISSLGAVKSSILLAQPPLAASGRCVQVSASGTRSACVTAGASALSGELRAGSCRCAGSIPFEHG